MVTLYRLCTAICAHIIDVQKKVETQAMEEKLTSICPSFPRQSKAVNICFAVNEKYALPLRNAIYSVVKNADASRCYDILVMTKNLSEEAGHTISSALADCDNVSVRFIDMTSYEEKYLEGVLPIQEYITVETDYRLFLATELFSKYDRMIYLDCDTLVLGDIAELFDTDLEGKALGAVEEYSFRYKEYQQNPVFVEGKPYSMRGYCTNLVGVPSMEDYFNAGLLLFDLSLFRKLTTVGDMMTALRQKHFLMNDQDVLNYIIKGEFKHLDVGWNYLITYEFLREGNNKVLKEKFSDVYRDEPKMIHYVGHRKPWRDEKIPFKALYDRVVGEL